ncbi:MAG: hypothetical protein HKN27_05345 [Silicimonas sp.]|nr:hypothetical protein [Silicimonas sp.]
MSASQFDEFDRRMRRISKRHSKLSQGYVTSVNPDGLVVAKPQRRSRRGTIRGLVILLTVMFVFKGVLHAQLGAGAYEDRVNALKAGSVVEQAGAWVMSPDPLTLWISSQVVSLVR